MEKVKTSLAVCVLMVIAVCAGIVLAGDVIVKQGGIDLAGDMAVAGDANMTDEVRITGSDAPLEADACDVLVVIGGTGGYGNEGEKGADILLTSGAGGDAEFGDGGDGGDIELTTGQGGDGEYGEDGSYGNIILAKNDGFVGIRTVSPTYPLVVDADVSDISIWCKERVSATGYTTRTSVFDKNKGSALAYVQDADYYLDAQGKIAHSRFYGYTSYSVTDISRPETETIQVPVIDEETGQKVYKEIEVTRYPHKKVEEAVSLNKEIDVLRQAVYELKQEIEMLKAQLP